MNTIAPAISALMLSALLLGCEQHPVTVTSPPAAMSQPHPAGGASAPTKDPSLPPVEAAMQSPKSGTDAKAGSTLTGSERDTQMPLPGQANDHSSPAIAKQGDSTSSAKSTK